MGVPFSGLLIVVLGVLLRWFKFVPQSSCVGNLVPNSAIFQGGDWAMRDPFMGYWIIKTGFVIKASSLWHNCPVLSCDTLHNVMVSKKARCQPDTTPSSGSFQLSKS
jgi:hypothetical protein